MTRSENIPHLTHGSSAPPPATRVVLFADDEPHIRNLAALVLRQNGFEVLLAEDGAQALDLYRREGRRIDLVILDLSMPNLSGEEAVRQLVALDPDVRVLLSSGAFDADSAVHDAPEVCGFIAKPYRTTELVRSVREALEPGNNLEGGSRRL
jgi:DNA-binding NtrC family response regulator